MSAGRPALLPSILLVIGLGGCVGWDIGFVIFALALIAVGWAMIRARLPQNKRTWRQLGRAPGMFDRGHWIRRDKHRDIHVRKRCRDGASKGMLAGAGGVAVMTMAEKVEQRITPRPIHTCQRM